jgi:hypothetical protein
MIKAYRTTFRRQFIIEQGASAKETISDYFL